MNLYDTLTQKALNSIIYKMLNYITIVSSLNIFSDLVNDYCTLEVDLKGNTVSGEEVIVTEDFIVNCTNREFVHLGYNLKLNYYYLPSDIDESHDGEVLKTVIIPLSEGENIISFEEYPIYLQGDCDLVIENDGTVNLPTPTARVRLTADNHSIIFGNDVTLTATVSLDGEPVTGGTVSFYDDEDVLVGTGVTDSNGECTCTVEDLALGDYWYHAVYDEFSSNSVEVVARKKNCSISITTSANSIYYSQSVSITGTLKDEFNTALSGVTVKLFQNGSQVATATTNTNGNYSFNRQYTTVGTYTFTVQYDGDNDYNSVISNTKSLTVNKAPVTVSIQSGASGYTRGDNILIGVSSNYGSFSVSSISVKFNGVTSTVSTKDSQGNFIFTIPSDVDNDDFVLTATYAGNSNYNSAVATSTVSIRIVDYVSIFKWESDLNIYFRKNGVSVANTLLHKIRVYKDNNLFMEFDATTDEYGEIWITNILQTGHSYYVKYGNLTSNIETV